MRIVEGLVKLSVRELVECTLRQGSIRSHVVSSNRAVLGTLAHKKIQKSMEPNYQAEVKLVHECEREGITYVVEGRADGIIEDLISVTIDEIKTTTMPLDAIDEAFNPLHWAQAQCYGYFYAKDKGLHTMQIRLTYYHIETKEIKYLQKTYTFSELEAFFKKLIDKYHQWIIFYQTWIQKRDGSLRALTFPFDTYRKGQREVAISVYKTIKNGNNVFINAPTGIGKTISTLFPALKAMGEGEGTKIFYLTAKTITRTVAEEGIWRLYNKGARIKSVTLTAKDKICFSEKKQCHPDECPWAEGHYDRVDEVVYTMLQEEDVFNREVIESYSRKYRVCPFELSLDLAVWVDVVICDYNYIFDPTVSLKRFSDYSDFILLIDEAHNLVDRAREMYSAGLSKKQVLAVKKQLGKQHTALTKELSQINEWLLELRKDYIDELGMYKSHEAPKNLYTKARRFIQACDKKLVQKGSDLPKEVLDLYFEIYHFNRCYELFDDHYICYGESRGSEVFMKLFCLDPSFAIGEITRSFKSAIFFSATLLPIDYFKDMLGGTDDIALYFDSPFEASHALRTIATDVSTRYGDRASSLDKICGYIEQSLEKKKGHYMVFFPSYKYMQDTYEHFLERNHMRTSAQNVVTVRKAEDFADEVKDKYQVKDIRIGDFTLYKQGLSMSEEEREAFLEHFEEEDVSTLNFCVLGGIFSEGIDLAGDRLIGVMIISVGLPQIGLERDLIKDYFDEKGKEGYHYAYTYPGINKVLQAIGRLIRTEEDRGTVLLMDDRYGQRLYQNLLPHPYDKVRNASEMQQKLTDFWQEIESK